MPVYFIRCGETEYVKIGVADDVAARMAGLQTAHYEQLLVVRLYEGDARAERWFHQRFRAQRVRGEWFRWHRDMATVEPIASELPEPFSGEGNLPHHAPLREAIEIAGGQAALAKALGKKQGHIWFWLNEAKKFPLIIAIKIEKITGGKVTRYRLCPDVFGGEA